MSALVKRTLRRLRSFWRARHRAIDRDLLWPACIEHAPSHDAAIYAFMMHACGDPSWCAEGDGEMTPVEAAAIVRAWPYKKAGTK